MKQEGETMVAKVAKIYCAKFRTDEQKSFDFSKRQDSKNSFHRVLNGILQDPPAGKTQLLHELVDNNRRI